MYDYQQHEVIYYSWLQELAGKSETVFMGGIAAFLIAHLFYCRAFIVPKWSFRFALAIPVLGCKSNVALMLFHSPFYRYMSLWGRYCWCTLLHATGRRKRLSWTGYSLRIRHWLYDL